MPLMDMLTRPGLVPASAEGREAEKAQMVRELFLRARNARRPLVGRWKKNYKVLNNRMWKPAAEPWLPAPEISEIWPVVASLVAWMTDQRPHLESTPSVPPFGEHSDYYDRISEHMNACLHSTFQSNMLDAEIERALWDMATYSVGYFKTTWEPWLADGLGDAAFRRIDPFTIYPDPYARSMSDAAYIIEAKIMTMNDLDRAYPGSAARVMEGFTEDIDESPHRADETTSSLSPRVNLGPIQGSGSGRYQDSTRSSASILRDDQPVVVLEAWIRTHESKSHDDDSDIPEGQARVTDRWKCVVVCGNTILMEAFADEIYAFPTHPYDKVTLFDTGEWYGPCLVEFLTSPQESINRLLANMEHNIMLVGNPIFMESERQANRTTKQARPGQRITGRLNENGWVPPPPLHPDMMNIIQYYTSKIETISGLSAIVRGFSPSGRNSTDVLSSVQDSAFVRVRATIRNLERALRGSGQKMNALIAEFYTEPRMIAVVGEDGSKTRTALKARHFYTLADSPENSIPLRFSILADAGSEHPTSRGARQEQGEKLFALGAIDEIEMLKAARWPNWPVVADRVMKMKAEAGMLGQPPGARQRSRS